MKNLHIYENEDELIIAYAEFFILQAIHFLERQAYFNVVLSGGSSPKKVYEILASPEYRTRVKWEKIYFFFGDERYVPANDPKYNGLMAENALFNPLNISGSQIFNVDTSLSPEESAEDYFQKIKIHFKKKPVQFDLILLGLGDNAHTASLFPQTEILSDKSSSVKAVFLKNEKVFRISMTAPLINQARQIAFLVFGENKAPAVAQVLEGKYDPDQYPAQLIKPEEGELHWFLDKMSAKLIR